MIIIGVHGRAGAGKDTFADHLVEKHSFTKRGFADPLYEEVAEAFGVTVPWLKDRERKERSQHDLRAAYSKDLAFAALIRQKSYGDYDQFSPREILQLWGTDYRRVQDETYWISQMHRFIEKNRDGLRLVVPDVRFANEALLIKSYEHGSVVEITRPRAINIAAAGHKSEDRLPDRLIDYTIYNSGGTKYELYDAADYYVRWAEAVRQVRTAK